MMLIQNLPTLSQDCKRHSHAVACYHMYKVCDRSPGSYGTVSSGSGIMSICRNDCEVLKVMIDLLSVFSHPTTFQNQICPTGFALAAEHELVGDAPNAMLPRCESLSHEASRCIRVLTPATPSVSL